MEFYDRVYDLAANALQDGGYNSKTYRKYAATGHIAAMAGLVRTQARRMDNLYYNYANGQVKLGWVDIEDSRLRQLAIDKQLQNQDYLPDDFRQSSVYRAYWTLYGFEYSHPLAPLPVYYSEAELTYFRVNEHLFRYVFEDFRPGELDRT